MKNYFMIGIVGLALGTTAQAITSDEYEAALDKLEKTYPIIQVVREENLFKATTKNLINKSQDGDTANQILAATIKKIIPFYIMRNTQHQNYDAVVEGLDPVYRDMINMPQIKLSLPCYKRED